MSNPILYEPSRIGVASGRGGLDAGSGDLTVSESATALTTAAAKAISPASLTRVTARSYTQLHDSPRIENRSEPRSVPGMTGITTAEG